MSEMDAQFHGAWSAVCLFLQHKHNSRKWLKRVVGTDVPVNYCFSSLDGSDKLLDSYNKIKNVLHYNQQDRFEFVKSIDTPPEYGNLDTLFSIIFLDFLLVGGLGYCGFCEYCDNFFVAERKGRKVFCSDICRTNNQRK